MLSKELSFTASDLKQILDAAWNVGACNLSGMANDLPTIISKARQHYKDTGNANNAQQHPVVRLWLGHMSYLAGIGLGPEMPDVEFVQGMLNQLLEGIK